MPGGGRGERGGWAAGACARGPSGRSLAGGPRAGPGHMRSLRRARRWGAALGGLGRTPARPWPPPAPRTGNRALRRRLRGAQRARDAPALRSGSARAEGTATLLLASGRGPFSQAKAFSALRGLGEQPSCRGSRFREKRGVAASPLRVFGLLGFSKGSVTHRASEEPPSPGTGEEVSAGSGRARGGAACAGVRRPRPAFPPSFLTSDRGGRARAPVGGPHREGGSRRTRPSLPFSGGDDAGLWSGAFTDHTPGLRGRRVWVLLTWPGQWAGQTLASYLGRLCDPAGCRTSDPQYFPPAHP